MAIVDTTPKVLVRGFGPKDAKIAFVGEAPGYNEVKKGKPFVGTSGDLLTEMMGRAGIIRSKCYLTNVIKERPKNNKIDPFINISRKEPKVSNAYLKYKDMLIEELKEVDANVIVAVGNIALYTLTGLKNITKRRGSIYESSILPGRKVIPIIHPRACIDNYNYRYFTLYELVRIKDQSGFPEIILP